MAVVAGDGTFSFSLPLPDWTPGTFYTARVFDPQGDVLHSTIVCLSDTITIVLPPSGIMKGQLLLSGDGQPEDVGLLAYALSPTHGAARHFLARVPSLNSDGSFALAGRVDARCSTILLSFQSSEWTFEQALPLASLVTTDGARIDLDLCDVELAVTNPEALGIDMAEARLQLHEGGFQASVRTDASGRAVVGVPVGHECYDICLTRDGFAPHVMANMALSCGFPLNVTLEELADDDWVQGIVRDPQGLPLEGAFVSAVPALDNKWAVSNSMRGSASAIDGTFRFAVTRAYRLHVRASHEDYGTTPDYILESYKSKQLLELRFESVGSVWVGLAGSLVGFESSGTSLDYYIAERSLARSYQGSENLAPFLISSLPTGDYNLFVAVNGGELYGDASVCIREGEETQVTVGLVPGVWLQGSLVDGKDEPVANATLIVQNQTWPPEFAALKGTVHTAIDGAFHIFTGSSQRADCVVRTEDGREFRARANVSTDPVLFVIQGGVLVVR